MCPNCPETKLKRLFATLNEIMDLGNDRQWLLTSEKARQPDIVCLMMKVHSTIYEIFLTKKKSNLCQVKNYRSNYQFTRNKGERE